MKVKICTIKKEKDRIKVQISKRSIEEDEDRMDMQDVGKATRVLSSVIGVTLIAYGIYLLTEKEPPQKEEPPSSASYSVDSSNTEHSSLKPFSKESSGD